MTFMIWLSMMLAAMCGGLMTMILVILSNIVVSYLEIAAKKKKEREEPEVKDVEEILLDFDVDDEDIMI